MLERLKMAPPPLLYHLGFIVRLASGVPTSDPYLVLTIVMLLASVRPIELVIRIRYRLVYGALP
jgi:hypothetical protein